ncbi:RcnB family protein [Sphingomonas tabacisoli]|uniref:RcnB family protein n=1 Tax=Sphingomonas tabacisoli TaxID=2249466 RepID=A0ABW4HZE5_9SPHN
MRKFVISALMAATVLPATGAMAQSYQEARQSQERARDARQDLQDAHRYGDRHDRREARENLRDARQEAREDWRDYRARNRQLYTMPRYYAPRGYAYRPARVGIALNPAFYGQRYWIADPYRYRLPAAVGPQRWVRYGNDVLLINVRNGRVLQVINGFFY